MASESGLGFLGAATSALLLIGLALRPSAAFQHDQCIDSAVCSCDNATVGVSCDCASALDERLQRSNLTIWPFTLQTTPMALVVRGCFSVRFHQVALSTCPPSGVFVDHVTHLVLQPLAFHKMTDCERLVFFHVSASVIPAYAFYHVANIRLIEFRHAFLDIVQLRAFDSLRHVDALAFVNCTIGRLESSALFNVTSVGRLSFIDCTLGQLHQGAIEARDVGRFEMLGTTVEHWGNRSVSLVNASHVTVANCSIERMEERALTAALTATLDFSSNRVEVLDAGAFDGFRDTEALALTGNVFGTAEAADALDALFASAVSLPAGWTMDVGDNWLPCDDRFCTLLHDDESGLADAAFFRLTFCSNGRRTLAEFLSLMDDDDVCQDGDHSSGAGNAHSGSTTASTSSSAVSARLTPGGLFALIARVALLLLHRSF